MDLISFSHLRWNFVFQRPQHLLSRCAKTFRTFYVEEPIFNQDEIGMQIDQVGNDLYTVTPMLPLDLSGEKVELQLQKLLADLFVSHQIKNYIAWFYTPMMLPLIDNLPPPTAVVYDCMDELSNFKFAPPEMYKREQELLEKADLVFTGGYSLYEAKKDMHHNIHPFPSSIDKEHFSKARNVRKQPVDQHDIIGPRIGFFGVIDERMDIELLEAIALKRPDWNLLLIGPIVKIDLESLPQLANIHYLGSKNYDRLPEYLGGWDVALIPFALNDSTQFISPTKTPEYLAGGVPVVSTAIRDVIDPYESRGLVYIGRGEDDFIQGINNSIELKKSSAWIKAVDNFLKDFSWNDTWLKMLYQLNKVLISKHSPSKQHKSFV